MNTKQTIRIKSASATGGWAREMAERGYKVLSRPARFGNEFFLIKRQGVVVAQFEQGRDWGRNAELPSGDVLFDLRAAGVVA